VARCGRYTKPARAGPRGLLGFLQRLGDAAPTGGVAHALSPFGWLLADAEFDSERNHRHVREKIGALSVIPAKRGGASWEQQGYRAQMRVEFPCELYRRRALVESVFSAVKRKLSTRAPGRSLETQRIQALLLGLAYNLYRL
jgi:hypothetical protein